MERTNEDGTRGPSGDAWRFMYIGNSAACYECRAFRVMGSPIEWTDSMSCLSWYSPDKFEKKDTKSRLSDKTALETEERRPFDQAVLRLGARKACKGDYHPPRSL